MTHTTPEPHRPDYAQMSTAALLFTTRELAEEIVRRIGFEEACRQTQLSEAEFRQLLGWTE